MDTSGIVDVLTSIGCSRIRVRDGYVGACCPFAPWKHKDGVDRHPSFFVKIEEMGSSCYHCFSCESKGLLSFMLKDLVGLGQDIPADLVTKVGKAEKSNQSGAGIAALNMFGFDVEKKLIQKTHAVWDEEEIAPYMGKTHRYVLDRGVSILTAKAFEIGYDADKKRVVFPIRRRDKKLVGAMTRSLDDLGSRYLPLFPFKKSLFLYGEDKLVDSGKLTYTEAAVAGLPANSAVIVMEGMFDVMRCFDFGYSYNVVGLMTSNMSKAQAATLREVGRPVYLMTDWDIAGVRGRESCLEYLFGKVPVYNVPGVIKCSKCSERFSKIQKVGQFDSLVCRKCGEGWPDISSKKDPGMLTKEETIDCLKTAELVLSRD